MRTTFLLSALLLIGSLALAQNREGRQREDRKDQKTFMSERLELTEDQQASMEDLRIKHLKTTSATKSELKIKHAELDAAISAEQANRDKVDQLIKEINALQGKLFEEKINHRLQKRALLDEKQTLIFDQMHGQKFTGPHRGKKG